MLIFKMSKIRDGVFPKEIPRLVDLAFSGSKKVGGKRKVICETLLGFYIHVSVSLSV